jgi:Fis family transcriptional regulator
MVNAKKATRARRKVVVRGPRAGTAAEMPLREHAEAALEAYFKRLNGHRPSGLYQLVLREVEEPLFRAVMQYTEGNQVRAAEILGINRGTLRRKLEDYGLVE